MMSGVPLGRARRRRGQQLRGRAHVLGVLLAVAVESLPEVGLPIEEPDGDERQPEVRGALEVVAREHAQAAAVDRQRLVDAELGREVGDRAHAQRPRVDARPRSASAPR